MKVSIVTITSNYDGNVELTTKLFSTFEKAAKYLYKEYLEIKAENAQDDDFNIRFDEIGFLEEDCIDYFYIEDEIGTYWVNGSINTMDVE